MEKSLLLISIVLLVSTANALSIGASPSKIVFDDMLRGGYAEGIITVGTGGDDDLSVHVEIKGVAKDWITIEPTMDFTLKAKKRFELKVILQPPPDIGNGAYEALINIRADSIAEVTGGVGMAFGAGIGVRIVANITDVEKSAYSVVKATVADTEIGYPAEFYIDIYNHGNVKNVPKMRIDLFDETGTKLVKTIFHNTTAILPSRKETILIRASINDLDVGRYMGSVGSYMVSKDETTNKVTTELVQHKTVGFNIFEKGTINVNGTMMNFVLDKSNAGVGDTVKITSLFRNNGQLLISAILEGEVLSGLEFVSQFESKETDVEPGESKNLVAYYTPTAAGTLTVKGAVRYGKKTTDSKDATLTVGGTNYLLYGAGALILIVVLVVFLKGKKT